MIRQLVGDTKFMKKIIILTLFVAIAVSGLTFKATKSRASTDIVAPDEELVAVDLTDDADEPKATDEEEEEREITGGICIECLYPSIKKDNFNVSVEGNKVLVSWSFSQFNKGKVKVYKNGVLLYAFPANGIHTYHTVKFQLDKNGIYEVQPVSVWQNREYAGRVVEVEITGNEELGYAFRSSLTAKQIKELLALAQKPKPEWTNTDYANWAYATNY